MRIVGNNNLIDYPFLGPGQIFLIKACTDECYETLILLLYRNICNYLILKNSKASFKIIEMYDCIFDMIWCFDENDKLSLSFVRQFLIQTC